jgi:hypothetical protein
MREELVIIYSEGLVTSLVRSEEYSPSVFGGALEAEISGGMSVGHLHQIATINHNQLPLLVSGERYVPEIPLLYGLFYDGCSIKYKVVKRTIVTIEALEPSQPAQNWPYANFPLLLPYAPLEIGASKTESWGEFSRRAPNLPELQPADLVVLVPPPATLGFSMWGRSGDAEGVTIVFECALEKNAALVTAYNVCS